MKKKSSAVLADPQWSVAKILRPWVGFEATYDPADSRVPIMFTQGSQALDPRAGQAGYDPQLVRGLPVPMGARIMLWIPRIIPANVTQDGVQVLYEWQIIHRLRNVADYRRNKRAYHYPKQGAGVPDAGSPRVVVPAAYETVRYNQPELSSTSQTVSQHVLRENISLLQGPILFQLPINPGGATGSIQQGILPAGGVLTLAPAYLTYETMAKGDEVLIGCSRQTGNDLGAVPTWEFGLGAADGTFSVFFGAGAVGGPFPDVGVYVFTGLSG